MALQAVVDYDGTVYYQKAVDNSTPIFDALEKEMFSSSFGGYYGYVAGH